MLSRDRRRAADLRQSTCGPRDEASVAEYLGLEAGDRRAMLPCLCAQSRLDAGMAKELVDGPPPFGRDLREQQPATGLLLRHQAMAADDDRGRVTRIDHFEWSEDRHFNRQLGD